LVGKCKNSLALIYTNQNNETKAKEMYKDVIATNPKSDDSKEAMVGLRNIYIDEANPNEYINYLANNANVVLNETAKDSLLFEAAETQYLQNNCEQAVAGFDSYLSQFANGVFALNSHYYRSDCYFNQKNYTQASIDYDWILAKPDNTFTEKSLLKAASIAYNETFDYEKAYQYYKRLLAISAYKENIALAKKGLLHTSFMLNKTTETIELANALLGENDASNDELTVIYYYLGKCYLNQNETSIALGQFKRMENYTINKYTAEGQYLIAKIMMESGELETAEKQCMYVADTYASYEYWVVKSYILLGDIYVKNKDYFQAKATYQSIVDGYDGDKNLVEECRAKIANIEANESKTNRIIDPSDTQPIIENNDNSNNNEK
jgi:TolA-binding protein